MDVSTERAPGRPTTEDAEPGAGPLGVLRYPSLFSSLELGPVTLRNRIVQTAHSKLFSKDGRDSQRDLDYHVERAKGGVGLIVTGMRPVHPTSVPSYGRPHYPLAYQDARDTDLRITRAVHEHGAAIVAQIGHFGHATSSEYGDDLRVLWGAGTIASTTFGDRSKAMELDDIAELREWWARSAVHAHRGGFDGVELHFAHGYLVHQFLSPLFNHREDSYGGSLENRMRLAREVAAAVRAQVPAGFVVGARLGMSDFCPGGYTIDDAVVVARALVDDGSIDYVSASTAGMDKSIEAAPSDIEDGWLLGLAAQLKEALPDVPVIAVGGLRDPAQAEATLAAGGADLIGMTRALIADPEIPNKLRDGRERDVYRCIRGNQGCIGRAFRGLPMSCTINPSAGRESVLSAATASPARVARRWVVVGGGPAGMKAAEGLATRGHHVTLLEREAQLGGQVRLVGRLPGRSSYLMLIEDLEHHLGALSVDVRRNVEVTPAFMDELQEEGEIAGVIVATGSVPDTAGRGAAAPLVRELPGLSTAHVLTTWDVVADPQAAGQRVVVLDDDGWRAAAGVCELLLDAGREVLLVTRFNSLLPGASTTHEQPILTRRLQQKGLQVRLSSWLVDVAGRSMTVKDLVGGDHGTVTADSIALVTAPEPQAALYQELEGRIGRLHRIGDCLAPRKIDHALYEGALAGRELWETEQRTIPEAGLERWR